MVRALVIVMMAVLAATPAQAINRSCGTAVCNNKVVSHVVTNDYVAPIAAVTAVPQYLTQNFFYSVGDQVRYPAIPTQSIIAAESGQLQREMQRLQDKITDFNQYQQQVQAQSMPQYVCVPVQQAQGYCVPQQPGVASNPQQPMPQQPNNPTFSMTQGGVIQAKCLACHGGKGAPKGNLDLRSPITCDQFKSAIDRLMTDDPDARMPKGQPPLTPAETAAAIKELSNMVQGMPAPQQQQQQPAFSINPGVTGNAMVAKQR